MTAGDRFLSNYCAEELVLPDDCAEELVLPDDCAEELVLPDDCAEPEVEPEYEEPEAELVFAVWIRVETSRVSYASVVSTLSVSASS